MRKFLQRVLSGPVIRLANKYSSRPDPVRVHTALTALYKRILEEPGDRGIILDFDAGSKLIVFSDQHKGTRNHRDDFRLAEKNYLAALKYYNDRGFTYCSLGDSEELWENMVEGVLKHNKETFRAEGRFLSRNAFIKVFGNHDLYWDNDPLAALNLYRAYGQKVKVYEGIVIRLQNQGIPLSLLLTHGHQGDSQSDGNWFSKWFVSSVWGPLQAFLRINPNTPAYDNQLKSVHNQIMYDWTAKQHNLALITGHTHQPVFNSLTHLERMYIRLNKARKEGNQEEVRQVEQQFEAGKISGDATPRLDYSKNTYFNTGCSCFDDGDITGIELEGKMIRLVEWKVIEGEIKRVVLEESALENLLDATEAHKVGSRIGKTN